MPSITYDRFDVGLDRRKGASVSDANRLRELKNAYVTTGKVIRKRPGLEFVATLEAGTKGLVSGGGVLNTFYDSGGITHADTRFMARALTPSRAVALRKIHYGDMFSGYLYVSAEYVDGVIQHHYLDASGNTLVTDANCPNSKGVIKIASRIFAVNGETVRGCKINNPNDWTTASTLGVGDGFVSLPTGLNARGATSAYALGQYDGKLAVFFVDSMQLWEIDTNEFNNSFYKNVDGVGTRYPKAVKQFAGDIIFMGRFGFRSVTTQAYTSNLMDVDVGSPIDTLVRADATDSLEPMAEYFSGFSQFWCMYPYSTNTRCWVYTYSKSAKISAWSEYEFGFAIDDVTLHNGYLYLRSGDNVYKVDNTDTIFSDNAVNYEMRAEMPFLDFKAPGAEKYIASMDLVVQGTVNIQFRYDPNDESKITDPITLTGDSRGGQVIPVEITTSAIAPVFTSTSGGEVQIDALTFYYENLGSV